MIKHFIIFYSPGTCVAEQSIKEIKSWDIKTAIKMSKNIIERYAARPYGFCFITKERKRNEFDSKEIKRSNFYYLGGKIITLSELKKKNDSNDHILISNMECNGWDKIIENNNSWKWTQPFRKTDIILSL